MNEPILPDDGAQQPVKFDCPDYQTQIEYMLEIVGNMRSHSPTRQIISGDTGLGKSTFVKTFAKVFGFPTIIIEIPHIVEEHLINIPFVVFDKHGRKSTGFDTMLIDEPNKGQAPVPRARLATKMNANRSNQTRLDLTSPRVELGTSYLVTQLAKLTKLSDSEYAAKVNTYDTSLKCLIQQFNESYPGLIKDIRKKYERILFFDEYFRQTSQAIRNVLRNVLNNKIGADIIPAKTYVMYASNLEDVSGSLDAQSAHAEFLELPFVPPTKNQWLQYTIDQILQVNLKVKQDVIDAFNNTLKDQDISTTDLTLELRISPRRWSDILVYVNNAYPFQSPEQFGVLRTTITRQFQTDDGKTVELHKVVDGMLGELAKKCGIDPNKVSTVSSDRWREVLAQQILTTVQTKGLKKYIPVIQGLPGVGKTGMGKIFENFPYNMRFISVEANTLLRDSVVGIPLPKKKNKNYGVTFSEPELYILINKQITAANEAWYEAKKENEGLEAANAALEEFKKQEYKYMIFIDELNRVKEISVFNSLRRLILEKEYNDQYKLPKGSVVVAAMNPTDLGTIKMTSHMRDAIDVIDVEPDWSGQMAFLKQQVIPMLEREKPPPSEGAIDTSLSLIEDFPKEFAYNTKRKTARQFYIAIGGEEEVYLSPRLYTTLFLELVSGINIQIEALGRRKDLDQEQVNEIIVKTANNKFNAVFRNIFYKNLMSTPPDWNERLREFLEKTVNKSLEMKTSQLSLKSLLNYVLDDTIKDLDNDSEFSNYLSAYVPEDFRQDFSNYVTETLAAGFEEGYKKLEKITKVIAKQLSDDEYVKADMLDNMQDVYRDIMNDILKGSPQEKKDDVYAKYNELNDILDREGN